MKVKAKLKGSHKIKKDFRGQDDPITVAFCMGGENIPQEVYKNIS